MFDFMRNWTKSAAARQQEAVSAYLDNALTPAKRQRFEQQMAQDPALHAEVEQQRQTRALLRQLPPRQVPRNFTLDPALYGRPARQPLVTYYPTLRAATVLTAVLLFFIVGLNVFSSDAGSTASAPDMAVSQLAVETSSEETAGAVGESDAIAEDEQAEMPAPESAPPAEPAMPAAEPTSVGEAVEEEAVSEEAVEGAPAAAEAPLEATAVLQPTPSPAATLEPGFVPAPLPTATVSDLPRLTATEVADRAELAATAVPAAPEADTDTANIAPTLAVMATAVTAQETPPSPPAIDLISVLVMGLFLLLVLLVILTLYARRKLP